MCRLLIYYLLRVLCLNKFLSSFNSSFSETRIVLNVSVSNFSDIELLAACRSCFYLMSLKGNYACTYLMIFSEGLVIFLKSKC